MLKKNKNKGLALIEIITAITLILLFGVLIISSVFVIPQTKIKETAQLIKTEFELTRNYAMTHGGDAEFTIEKTSEGAILTRTGVKTISETSSPDKVVINDAALKICYYKCSDGNNEFVLQSGETLTFKFTQMSGAICSSKLTSNDITIDDEIIVDCIKITNRSKDYKILIEYKTGLVYFDFELDKNRVIDNESNLPSSEKVKIDIPKFILNGEELDTVTLQYTGSSIQPEIKYDSEHIKIGGTYRAINDNVDGYVITFTLKDPSKTQWVTGKTDSVSLIWIIERKD